MNPPIPPELDLPPPSYPSAANLVKQAAQLTVEISQETIKKSATPEIPVDLAGYFANAGTQAWRMRNMVLNPLNDEPRESLEKEEIQKLARYVRSMYEALAGAGVAVCDRTGQPFDYGYPEKVVSAEPKEGITQPIVTRTFRPRIMWRDRIVQQGEVDIATPIN